MQHTEDWLILYGEKGCQEDGRPEDQVGAMLGAVEALAWSVELRS